MSQDNLITLKCKETGEIYMTRINKRTHKDTKLKLRKYSAKLRKVVEFVQTKKLFR